ncbi:hypothetical protein, partial [Streptomyces microflavus]
LEHLGRELDSTTGLIDALRAQDHEHANRLHSGDRAAVIELGNGVACGVASTGDPIPHRPLSVRERA